VEKIKIPIQGHYRTQQAKIPQEHDIQIQQEIERHHAPVELFIYEGAAHGFANYTDSTYNLEAAQLAEGRMIEFLRRHLGPTKPEKTG
jgi:carboxymethylenebutenolidase